MQGKQQRQMWTCIVHTTRAPERAVVIPAPAGQQMNRTEQNWTEVLFSSHLINPVNVKKPSHWMFRYMHGVLNEVYLQNFFA